MRKLLKFSIYFSIFMDFMDIFNYPENWIKQLLLVVVWLLIIHTGNCFISRIFLNLN